jgi:hypothetical protein
MKIITYKANGIDIEDLIIHACADLPKFEKYSLQEIGEIYKKEAAGIVDCMFKCLPGGLIDAIMVEMLDKKRSLLSVSFIN